MDNRYTVTMMSEDSGIQNHRIPRMAGGMPLVLLAMVLLATAGGAMASRAVGPGHASAHPAMAVLAFPAHHAASIPQGLVDTMPELVVAISPMPIAEPDPQLACIIDEHLNLPPPRG